MIQELLLMFASGLAGLGVGALYGLWRADRGWRECSCADCGSSLGEQADREVLGWGDDFKESGGYSFVETARCCVCFREVRLDACVQMPRLAGPTCVECAMSGERASPPDGGEVQI